MEITKQMETQLLKASSLYDKKVWDYKTLDVLCSTLKSYNNLFSFIYSLYFYNIYYI